MYEFIFDELNKLQSKTQKRFNNTRLQIQNTSDPKKIKKKNDALFGKLTEEDYAFLTALLIYLDKHGYDSKDISVDEYLEEYNPTLLYVYKNEAERKRDRYFESLVAFANEKKLNSADALVNQKRNARSWSRQVEEIGVDLERKVYKKTWRKRGYTRIQWITKCDNKVCKECGELHNKIFAIENVPRRPHIGCRCEMKPVK